MTSSGLVHELASDSVDIIGDVHGEVDALKALLARLGCDPTRGTVERKIVFVGDLVDRGPDSVQVIEIAQRLVEAGNAQVVLGNHELNILLGDKKEGNGWFLRHTDNWWSKGEHVPFASRSAETDEQKRILAFLSSLPVALESSKLRIVHAAWEPEAIAKARKASSLDEFMKAQEVDLTGIDLMGAPTRDSLLSPITSDRVRMTSRRAHGVPQAPATSPPAITSAA
jgi:predicted MPP superfamily phosphohydrolase